MTKQRGLFFDKDLRDEVSRADLSQMWPATVGPPLELVWSALVERDVATPSSDLMLAARSSNAA
jgi:hypothetical protein